MKLRKNEKATELLFGKDATRIMPSRVAPVLGVGKDSVYRWRKDIDAMPLGKVRILARLQNLTDEEKAEILT